MKQTKDEYKETPFYTKKSGYRMTKVTRYKLTVSQLKPWSRKSHGLNVALKPEYCLCCGTVLCAK